MDSTTHLLCWGIATGIHVEFLWGNILENDQLEDETGERKLTFRHSNFLRWHAYSFADNSQVSEEPVAGIFRVEYEGNMFVRCSGTEVPNIQKV